MRPLCPKPAAPLPPFPLRSPWLGCRPWHPPRTPSPPRACWSSASKTLRWSPRRWCGSAPASMSSPGKAAPESPCWCVRCCCCCQCPSPLIPLLLHLAAFWLACQCPAVRMVAPSQTIPGMALFAQVDALGLITGSASPSECVRAPASCAVVEGTYALNARHSGAARILLEACGLPARALPVPGRPCSIIVRREVRACDCLCPA